LKIWLVSPLPHYRKRAWNDDNAGRQLAYLVAYNHSDGPRCFAIFQQKVAGTGGAVGHHGLTAAQMQTNYDQNLAVSLLTRVIAGDDQNGQATYAAAWREAPTDALAASGGIV
jgi:hypothetical protein